MAKKTKKMLALLLAIVFCVNTAVMPVVALDGNADEPLSQDEILVLSAMDIAEKNEMNLSTEIENVTDTADEAVKDVNKDTVSFNGGGDPVVDTVGDGQLNVTETPGETTETKEEVTTTTETPTGETTEITEEVTTTTETSAAEVTGTITSDPVYEGLQENELPDTSDVTDLQDVVDNGFSGWEVTTGETTEDYSFITLTKTETTDNGQHKLSVAELEKVLGVQGLTATGEDTYTYTDANGATVTITVTDNSTEETKTDYTVTLTQVKGEVPVDQGQPSAEDPIQKELNTLDPSVTPNPGEDGTNTYSYIKDNMTYVITEKEVDIDVSGLSNEQLAQLMGPDYSVNAEGKIVDAYGQVLTVSAEKLGGKTVIRTMTKTENVSPDKVVETENNAIANALQNALDAAGLTGVKAEDLVKNEDGTYTYTDANGKTYTYTVTTDSVTGEPVKVECTADDGADSCTETTVTITATVTGEKIVETLEETEEVSLFEIGEDGKKLFDGGEVTGDVENADGTRTLTVEKDGKTYTYTLTSSELTEEEKAALMEEGKEYNFTNLKKVSWTAVTKENIELEVNSVEGVANNGDGTYTLTVDGQTIQVAPQGDGNYHKVGGTASDSYYTITETTKTADEIKAMLEEKGYAVNTVTQNVDGYTVTSADGSWTMSLPLATTVSVTQRTAHTEASNWTGNVTDSDAMESAKQSAISSFIQNIKEKFMSLAIGEKIVLGTGENKKTYERSEDITAEDIERTLTTDITNSFNTWVVKGTAVNFDAMSPEALTNMLNDIADTAKVTEYDFTSYYNEGWKINDDWGTHNSAADAEAAAKDKFSVNVVAVDGKNYAAERDRIGWYYIDENGTRQNVHQNQVQKIVPNYMNDVDHLDLGIDGELKLQENGEWVNTTGFILPNSGDKIKIYWGDTADAVVNIDKDSKVAEQSKDHIVQDQNTGLFEYNVHGGDSPNSSKFYRVEATFVYDPVVDENGNIREFYTQTGRNAESNAIEAAREYVRANGGYYVERRDDNRKLKSIQVYKKTAPLVAYGYMTQEANTCGNKLQSNGYDLTLSELTLINDTVYAGGLGSITLSLNYEVIKDFVKNELSLAGEKEMETSGSGQQGSYTASWIDTKENELNITGDDSYSYHTANYSSSNEVYNGSLNYSYITAEGEKETVKVRDINAEMEIQKVSQQVTQLDNPPDGGDNPPGGGDNPPLNPPPGGGVPVVVNIVDDDVPLGGNPQPRFGVYRRANNPKAADDADGTIILDEEVPLADAPKTGDFTDMLAIMSLASLGGLMVLSRKKEEAEA